MGPDVDAQDTVADEVLGTWLTNAACFGFCAVIPETIHFVTVRSSVETGVPVAFVVLWTWVTDTTGLGVGTCPETG